MQNSVSGAPKKAGVTSALKLDGAISTYLSGKHKAAKATEAEMALKEVNKDIFCQCDSLAVVSMLHDEVEIDILARLGI